MRTALTLTVLALLLPSAGAAAAVEPERPVRRGEQTVLRAESFVNAGEMAYLAFPSLIRIGEDEVLISYKRGRSHALDPGAVLEAIRFNTADHRVVWRKVLASDRELIQQMGEWIRFSGGRIGNFVDVQRVVVDQGANRHHRAGTRWTVSDDGGETFSPMVSVGPVEGVEYGYVFDSVISNARTYMLAMSFPELGVRKSLFDEDGRRLYGEVSVLASDDGGARWTHVRNLTREFGGIPINESALIARGDGFIVATRGYDSKARLHRVDHQFRVVRQRNLTDAHAFISSHIGRPRLFARDGALYLLGRNQPPGGSMVLGLFRIDPDSLGVQRYVVLDPEQEGVTIADGYYAVHYFQESPEQGPVFHVMTYRRAAEQPNPDIVRLEFLWEDVR